LDAPNPLSFSSTYFVSSSSLIVRYTPRLRLYISDGKFVVTIVYGVPISTIVAGAISLYLEVLVTEFEDHGLVAASVATPGVVVGDIIDLLYYCDWTFRLTLLTLPPLG
jgi:hypothetical protein